MFAPSSSTVRSSRSASNAPPALSPRDTLADSLASGRENASTTDAGSREYRICRNCGSNAVVGAEKFAGASCVSVSTPESRSTAPASHAIGSAHMAQRLSPIDAMSRIQTVSSTTVLPHERPVNTVFCRKMLMRAIDASSGNSEVKASAHCAGAECRTRSDSLAAPIPASAQTVHASAAAYTLCPSAGRYSNSLIGSRANSAVHHRGNSCSRIGTTADLTV